MKKGIDISEHNGVINFNELKNQNIEFVIIRLGWIGNNINHTIDKYFEENYKKAKESGLKVGLYVYNYCKSISSVQNGIRWIKDILNERKIELPLFIDMEDNSLINIGKSKLTEICEVFCNSFPSYKTGVYANKFWFNSYLDINRLLNFKIWLAEWTNNSNHSFNYKVDLWQYSSKGSLTGIKGNVDMNYCMCECEENTNNNYIKKSNEVIADEVIKGLWGNGKQRQNKLELYGYNYNTIQNIVNQKMNYKKEIVYIVKSGDNLTNIAKKYNTTVDKIAQDNGIKNKNLIYDGQQLIIK